MQVGNLITKNLSIVGRIEDRTSNRAGKDLYLGGRLLSMGGTNMPWSPPSTNNIEYLSILIIPLYKKYKIFLPISY